MKEKQRQEVGAWKSSQLPKIKLFQRWGVHVCFTFPMQDLVRDLWNFNTKNVKHSITIDRGPSISSLIHLTLGKVLFVSKDFEDPVKEGSLLHAIVRRPSVYHLNFKSFCSCHVSCNPFMSFCITLSFLSVLFPMWLVVTVIT